MAVTIGVDVGGTKIAAGAVADDGTILGTLRTPTPETPAAIAADIARLALDLSTAHGAEAIGICAAGFIQTDRQTVAFAPNLPWRNEALGEQVSALTRMPVVVENDANAAAWGEFRFGAAKGSSSMVLVTVGTGIGGGIVLDGHVIRGSHGFAAEIGHTILKPGGEQCGCGLRGCWEAHGSGNALVRVARARATESPDAAATLLSIAGDRPIGGLDITEAAKRGDAVALEAFAEIGWWNGVGLASMAAILDPEVLVISGGVCDAGEILLEPIQNSFAQALTARDYREPTPIHIATLGNSAGLVGAADLARL